MATKNTKATVTNNTSSNKANKGRLQNRNWEDNLHLVIGFILLIVGLRQLRQWIIGLVLIILGILFVTGYFESKKK